MQNEIDVSVLHKLANFNRERIAERVTHAKGAGAFGVFRVTHSLADLSCASVFGRVGLETPVFARFSNYRGEKGSADTLRDPRGFAVKFYAEDGIWDFVGNSIPVFFLRTPERLPDLIHSQKRVASTNLFSNHSMWDFLSHSPESLHAVLLNYGDRGIPRSYRHMHGYSCHALALIADQEAESPTTWARFHLRSNQGTDYVSDAEAERLAGSNPDLYTEDLLAAIDRMDHPGWTLSVQVMSDAQARAEQYDPFDVTRVWSQQQFPLRPVGVLELNRRPD